MPTAASGTRSFVGVRRRALGLCLDLTSQHAFTEGLGLLEHVRVVDKANALNLPVRKVTLVVGLLDSAKLPHRRVERGRDHLPRLRVLDLFHGNLRLPATADLELSRFHVDDHGLGHAALFNNQAEVLVRLHDLVTIRQDLLAAVAGGALQTRIVRCNLTTEPTTLFARRELQILGGLVARHYGDTFLASPEL